MCSLLSGGQVGLLQEQGYDPGSSSFSLQGIRSREPCLGTAHRTANVSNMLPAFTEPGHTGQTGAPEPCEAVP